MNAVSNLSSVFHKDFNIGISRLNVSTYHHNINNAVFELSVRITLHGISTNESYESIIKTIIGKGVFTINAPVLVETDDEGSKALFIQSLLSVSQLKNIKHFENILTKQSEFIAHLDLKGLFTIGSDIIIRGFAKSGLEGFIRFVEVGHRSYKVLLGTL